MARARLHHRTVVASALAAAAALLAFGARRASAEPAAPAASARCDRVSEPGRVKCSVEVAAPPGASLAWADVAILEIPELAVALKGRLGPADATAQTPAAHRWAFGLVAKKAGRGDVKVRVRTLVCLGPADAGPPRCVPMTSDATATVEVGS